MKECPILFSTEMVRAIIEGRKTQTRRAMKWHDQDDPDWQLKGMTFDGQFWKSTDGRLTMPCPYGQPGDRLWVRETFWQRMRWGYTSIEEKGWVPDSAVKYVATDTKPDDVLQDTWWKMKPSIFMRRDQSRMTLELTEVRVQRVQDISEADAEAEGIVAHRVHAELVPGAIRRTAKDYYWLLWDSINAKREGGTYAWAKNPWVWAVSFKRIFPK